MSEEKTRADEVDSPSASGASERKSRPDSRSGNRQNVALPDRIASGLAGAVLVALASKHGVGAARSKAGNAPRTLTDSLLFAAGGYLIVRGATGHCAAYHLLRTGTLRTVPGSNAVIPAGQGILVESSLYVHKPVAELYDAWRDFTRLPRWMSHLESVEILDETRSRWTAKAPLGTTVAWNAEIIDDTPGERIAWKSVEPADIPNAGSVRFVAKGDGAEVHVRLEYNPPGGTLGAAVAKLFGEEPKAQIREDLRRFKAWMETGEAPSTAGQPHGGVRMPMGGEIPKAQGKS